jgi:hypothetical protein
LLGFDGQPQGIIGERGLYIGNLTRPKGVVAGSENEIYVVESLHDHLLVYDQGGQFLLPIAGIGGAAGQFFLPAGVWTDGRGRIFLADMYNGRVVMLDFLGS